MANTDLENKIANTISNIIVALKAKGEKQISTEKIVNYITDKFDVVLDDDYVSDILSKSPAVAEINDDKIVIGQAPDDSEDAVQDELSGDESFSDGSDMMGGSFGGDMGGEPMSSGGEDLESDMENMDSETPELSADEQNEMQASLDELKVESLQIGDIINIKNKKLDTMINEHLLFAYRKNGINLKVRKINENGIYCRPTKGDSSLLIKLKKD